MNYKMILTGVLLFFLITMISALTIDGSSTISLCQCETETPVYSICANTTGTYSVSISGLGSKWVKLAPIFLDITAGSCKEVFVFVTPECYATSGTFPFNINVSGPESTSKRVSLFVEQCHTFNFNVTPTSNTSKPCEQNNYNINITNTGKFVDEYVLLQKGLPDSWVSYPRGSFVLQPNESLNTILKIESFCNTISGSYPFSLELSNTRTNASKTINLVQGIEDFKPINTNIESNISICSEEGFDYNIAITNISSKRDEITINLDSENLVLENFVSINNTKIVLEPQETKYVLLKINPSQPQTKKINLTFYSKNYERIYSKEISVKLEDCYNVSIERKSFQENFCLGNNSQSFIVYNNGTKTIEALVSVEGVDVESKLITINPSLEKEIVFNFFEQEGSKEIIVFVETNYSKDLIEYSLNFENCYGAELVVPNISVCSNETKNIPIIIKNLGIKEQFFDISTNASWITLNQQEILIQPQSEEEIILTLNVPKQIEKDYFILAKSDNAELSRNILIDLLSVEECYSFNLTKTKEIIDVNCCDGKIIEILLKNTGNFSQTFFLEKIAPEWVSFSHEEVTLNPQEESIVYVYYSPPVGTNGQLTSTIKITNQLNHSKTFDFNLNVFGGNCGVGLSANLDVDGQAFLIKTVATKEIGLEFNIVNDSNIGFNIIDITIAEYPDVKVNFEKGIFLTAQDSTKAMFTISFFENQEPEDRELTLNILTSVGEFQKKQFINFSDISEKPIVDEILITGFLTQFVAPATGIILLLILLIAIVIFSTKKNSKKKIKKK